MQRVLSIKTFNEISFIVLVLGLAFFALLDMSLMMSDNEQYLRNIINHFVNN